MFDYLKNQIFYIALIFIKDSFYRCPKLLSLAEYMHHLRKKNRQ